MRFVREGAKVAICDIQDCEPVINEIKAIGGEVLGLKTDVTSEAGTSEMAQKTFERFGKIDVLVNNAGIGVLWRIKISLSRLISLPQMTGTGCCRLMSKVFSCAVRQWFPL